MGIQHHFYSFLQTLSGFPAVLTQRVYPVALPQGTVGQTETRPALTYRIASRVPFETPDLDNEEMMSVAMELTLWAPNYETLDAADQVRLALQNWVTHGDGLIGPLSTQAVTMQREEDVYDEDLLLFGRQQVWEFTGADL